MSKEVKSFIKTLIQLEIICSIGEAKVLAKVATPRYDYDWRCLVDTAALRAAHKKEML